MEFSEERERLAEKDTDLKFTFLINWLGTGLCGQMTLLPGSSDLKSGAWEPFEKESRGGAVSAIVTLHI